MFFFHHCAKVISCIFLLCLLSGQAVSGDTNQEDIQLLADEIRDARKREKAELKDREQDLQQQLESSRSLLEKQERYIQLLQQKLEQLQSPDSQPDTHTD